MKSLSTCLCEHSTPIYNHLFYKVHVSGCVSKACKVQVGRSVIDLKEQAEKRGNPASSSLVLPNIHSPCLLASWNGGGGNSFQPFSRSYWKNRASKVQITGRDEILWGPNATLCVQGLSPSEHEWWPKAGIKSFGPQEEWAWSYWPLLMWEQRHHLSG